MLRVRDVFFKFGPVGGDGMSEFGLLAVRMGSRMEQKRRRLGRAVHIVTLL